MIVTCPQCRREVESGSATGDLLTCPYCEAQVPTIRLDGDAPALSPTLMGETPNRPTQQESGKTLPPGTLVGQYVVEETIGRGGMGAVYRGRHTMLDRTVAIKVLPADLAADTEFIARFKREANALARLQHPNIVTVYDMGIQGDLYYFVMEFVDGVNLRSLLHHKQLKPEQALAIIPKLCEALEYAHEQGVVHRDIKPENIMLDKRGEPKIADFGLAKIVKGDRGRTLVTQTQTVMGTVDYMAPEQREATKTADHRSDIYSLGVVLYEMLTGDLPIGRFAAPSKKVRIDARVDDVVLRALEYEPSLRYQHASELGREVSRLTHDPTEEPGTGVNIGRCLNDALLVWKHNWGKLAAASLIANLMGGLSLFILLGAAQGGLMLLGLRALRRGDRTVRFEDLFGAIDRFFALLVALLLMGLGTVLGFVCLIVPGIVVGTYWMFSPYAIIERRRGPIEGMRDSWNLVKATGVGQCVLLFVISMLFSFGPQGLPFILSVQEIPEFGKIIAQSIGGVMAMFFAPITMLMVASAWNQLTKTAVPVYEPAKDPKARRWPLWAIAATLLSGCCMLLGPMSLVLVTFLLPGYDSDPEVMRNQMFTRGQMYAILDAQERFRRDDVDKNGVADYWTGELAGLHTLAVDGQSIKLISRELAAADAAAGSGGDIDVKINERGVSVSSNVPAHNGYVYRAIPHPDGYAVVAWPALHGVTGRRTFIINQNGILYSSDTDGLPIDRWPTPAELEEDWSALTR